MRNPKAWTSVDRSLVSRSCASHSSASHSSAMASAELKRGRHQPFLRAKKASKAAIASIRSHPLAEHMTFVLDPAHHFVGR